MNLLEQCGLKMEYLWIAFYRRERPPAASAALRSDRAEGAGAGTGRRDGLARADGLWRDQPFAHGQNIAALDGFADGDRDCGYRGEDITPVAAPGRDGVGGIGYPRRGTGAEIPCESGKAPDLTPRLSKRVATNRLGVKVFPGRANLPLA